MGGPKKIDRHLYHELYLNQRVTLSRTSVSSWNIFTRRRQRRPGPRCLPTRPMPENKVKESRKRREERQALKKQEMMAAFEKDDGDATETPAAVKPRKSKHLLTIFLWNKFMP